MLKTFLLASSFLIAAPALAQETPMQDSTQTAPQTTPGQTDPQTTPAPTTDDQAPGTTGAGTVDDSAAQPAPATTPAPNGNTPPASEATQPTPDAADPNATPDASANAGTAGMMAANTATPAAAPAGTPATSATQVAEAVSRDFPGYDKDSNGMLSQDEFGAWMSTLRKASEPTFAPGSPDAQTWVGQAFAATDTDKNQSVSKEELAMFLTPKAQ